MKQIQRQGCFQVFASACARIVAAPRGTCLSWLANWNRATAPYLAASPESLIERINSTETSQRGERCSASLESRSHDDKFTRYARVWNGTESPRILGERGWEEKQDLKRNAIRGFLEIVRWTKPAKQSVFKIYGFAEFAICFPNSFNNPINKTNYPRVEKRVRGF